MFIWLILSFVFPISSCRHIIAHFTSKFINNQRKMCIFSLLPTSLLPSLVSRLYSLDVVRKWLKFFYLSYLMRCFLLVPFAIHIPNKVVALALIYPVSSVKTQFIKSSIPNKTSCVLVQYYPLPYSWTISSRSDIVWIIS